MRGSRRPSVTSAKYWNASPIGTDTRRIFDVFVRFAACAVAAQLREAEYLEEAQALGQSRTGIVCGSVRNAG